MTPTIKISRTYEVITEESAEHGEAAESGFDFESEPYTFRELVEMMKEYDSASCYPLTGNDFWVTKYGTQDDWFGCMPHGEPGDEVSYSLHFDHDNPPRLRKYWLKAWRMSREA